LLSFWAIASSKTDIPTAEQIFSKLLGGAKKAPDPEPAQLQPQSLLVLCPNNPQVRSPLKTILGNIPLIPNKAQGATDRLFACLSALPPPPPGYHYGRPRRPHKNEDDEYGKSYGNEQEEDAEDDVRQNDDENAADEDNTEQRYGLLGRKRGRGYGRQCGEAKPGKQRLAS